MASREEYHVARTSSGSPPPPPPTSSSGLKRSAGRLENPDWKGIFASAKRVNWNGFKNNPILQAMDRYDPQAVARPWTEAPASGMSSLRTSTDIASSTASRTPRRTFEQKTPTPHDTRPPSPNHPFRARTSTSSSRTGSRHGAMPLSRSTSGGGSSKRARHTRNSSDARSSTSPETDSVLTAIRAAPVADGHKAASRLLGMDTNVSNASRLPPSPPTPPHQPLQDLVFNPVFPTALFDAPTTSDRQQFMNQFTFRSAPQASADPSTIYEPTLNPEQVTFYSSESEDDDESTLSQGSPRQSTRSSRTSYGISSPQVDDGNPNLAADSARSTVNKVTTHSSPPVAVVETQQEVDTSSPARSQQTERRKEVLASSAGLTGMHKSGPRNFSRPSVSEVKPPVRRPPSQQDPPKPAEALPDKTKSTGSKQSSVLKILSGKERRSARPLSLAVMRESESIISADAAETVILHIFESVDDFKDLFSLARINRGFYNIFKIHELALMKNTLHNISPPAWELREASPKEILVGQQRGKDEYTPTLYMQFHTRDMYVLSVLKSVIYSRCQKHLREETIAALRERSTLKSTRVDDALWRIWTFCTIFGADRGGEFDLESQTHWLRGGMSSGDSVQRPSTSSTRTSTRKTLGGRSADSHHFGRGNLHGLTLDELYDIEELWNCIKALLNRLVGQNRIEQARDNAVFQGKKVNVGDKVAEAALLDEWTHHLATLGLSAVSDLAMYLDSPGPDAFVAAKDMEWTVWEPPREGATRKNFLKDAVSRVYDERLAATREAGEYERDEIRARRKSNRISLAIELKEKKKSVDFSHELALGDERPMSLWVQWINKLEPPSMTQTPPTPTVSTAPKQSPRGSAKETSRLPPRSVPRSRASSGTLSLIPPEYRNNTPNSSARPTPLVTPVMSPSASPQRSRASSLRNTDLAQAALAQARQKALSPRGSRRPSLLRAGSNPTLGETLYEEDSSHTAEAQSSMKTAAPPRPATAHTSAPTTIQENEQDDLMAYYYSAMSIADQPSTRAANEDSKMQFQPPSPPPKPAKNIMSRIPRRTSSRPIEAGANGLSTS